MPIPAPIIEVFGVLDPIALWRDRDETSFRTSRLETLESRVETTTATVYL